jgi:hypothetical protein
MQERIVVILVKKINGIGKQSSNPLGASITLTKQTTSTHHEIREQEARNDTETQGKISLHKTRSYIYEL